MQHKNARKLLDEIRELIKELDVYVAQRKAFFSSLKKLDGEYDSGKLAYLAFEEKQKAALHGRSKEEWAAYYKAYIYSLLKKIEFIVSQVIALVRDDTSLSSLAVDVARKAPQQVSARAVASSQPVAAATRLSSGHLDVFNIDNEIARLKAMLDSRRIAPGELAVLSEPGRKPRLEVGIPKFEDLSREIEAAEKAASKARLKAVSPVQPREVKFAPVAGNVHKLQLAGIFRRLVLVARAIPGLVADVPLTAFRSLKGIGHLRSRKAAALSRPVDFSRPAEIPRQAVQVKPNAQFGQKQSVLSAVTQLFSSKKEKGIFAEEIVAMEKKAKISEKTPAFEQKEPAGLAFGWFSPKGMLRELTERFRSKQEPIMGETTAIPVHVKKLKEMRRKLYDEERLSGFNATLLAQEARRVKKILEVEKPEVYQGSSVGLIANLTVRKISLALVDTFPEFFGFLYNGLRAANVKVLSNTYVNIMILSTLFVTVISFFALGIFFFIIGYPLYQVVLRAVILSVVAGFSCATIFYAYPFMKIKDRKRKIMTNMPFAINHMAAVATSGVPPVSMFELISASGEYSEIAIEIKKIVDFINIFGYDLLTAVRTVAATTPSPHFKEFLEGIVSTIETGGDLDRYLRQEADQATLTYNLERQRYNETVSTYSDIYTGLLIAAPLFFVAAMALVNLLGGTLGGIGVDIVMAVGAYAVIPLLNLGFLLFLQVTQPEV